MRDFRYLVVTSLISGRVKGSRYDFLGRTGFLHEVLLVLFRDSNSKYTCNNNGLDPKKEYNKVKSQRDKQFPGHRAIGI